MKRHGKRPGRRRAVAVSVAGLMVAALAAPDAHAVAAAGLTTLSLTGPGGAQVGVPTRFTGILRAGTVGLPLQPVEVVLDGSTAASTVTGVKGVYSVEVTIGSLGDHELVAVAALGTRSPVLKVQGLAPLMDPGVATPLRDSTSFLYTGPNATQRGVAPGTITLERAAVVRGAVLGPDTLFLEGVKVSVRGHPEFGWTLTRAGGAYDLAVNGGEHLDIAYEKDGYIPVQREVPTGWQDYAVVDPVVMTAYDPNVTEIPSGFTEAYRVVRGGAVADEDGERRATLLVPRGVQATMTLPDGTTAPLTSMHVRSTEFTVGGFGDEAMPGSLPPTSAYTYATEFSIDEAVSAEATTVAFDLPLLSYTENFVGAPVGTDVPAGYYDRDAGRWIPSGDGRIVKIVGITAGRADVDVTGDGVSDGNAALDPPLTDDERAMLASLYAAGAQLWRVKITHFSPWDYNFPYAPPDGAQDPPAVPGSKDTDCKNTTSGSIISCESQTLGEMVPVTGTPFTLAYASDRVPGWRASETLDVPVTGGALPPRLKGAEVDIKIAGRTINQRWEDPAGWGACETCLALTPNITYRFRWDGLDAYGRPVQGRPIATVRTTYVYDFVYAESKDDFDEGFGQFGDDIKVWDGRIACGNQQQANPYEQDEQKRREWQEQVDRLHFYCGIPVSRTVLRAMGAWSAAGTDGLGGWTLDIHHAYDPTERVLHRGDGTDVHAEQIGAVVRTVAGGGDVDDPDGLPALRKSMAYLTEMDTGPDGSVYFLDGFRGRVFRIDPQDNVRRIAGRNLLSGETWNGDPQCDGRQARDALFHAPADIAVADDGSVYFTVIGRNSWVGYICRVTTDGRLVRIAGRDWGGTYPYYDRNPRVPTFAYGEMPALDARLSDVAGLAVASDGTVYFSDRKYFTSVKDDPDCVKNCVYVSWKDTIRAVDPSGTTRCLENCSSLDPAAPATIGPIAGVEVGPDGSLYLADPNNARVRRLATDGSLVTFAGNGQNTEVGIGGPAAAASIYAPMDVSLTADGVAYVRSRIPYLGDTIYRVAADGTITNFTSSTARGDCNVWRNDVPVRALCPLGGHSRSVSVTPDGTVYVTDGRWSIRKLVSPLSGFSATSIALVSSDGSELYEFDGNGRHVKTRDALTGALVYGFTYDASRRFAAITDGDGNTTSIERAPDGTPIAVVGPYGQRTTLGLDADGWLARVSNPAGESFAMSSSSDGLLATFTDPRGGVRSYGYDGAGRLESAQDPTGATKTLTRTETASTLAVKVRSAMGLETTYALEDLPNGDRARTVTEPSGAVTRTVTSPDGTTTTTAPDGTVQTVTVGPDPRWGMQAPMVTNATVAVPGLPAATMGEQRTVQLADPKDLMSVRSLTVAKTLNGRTFTTTYDSGTVTNRTAAGRTNAVVMDTQGRVIEARPDGAIDPLRCNYDARGRLTEIVQGTRTLRIGYDALGRPETYADANGGVLRVTYDAADRVVAVTDRLGKRYDLSRDAAGNLTGLEMPSGAKHALDYTILDQLSGYAPPGAAGQTWSYDADRRLVRWRLPGGRIASPAYDSGGRRTAIAYPEASVGVQYADVTARPASVTRTAGVAVQTTSFTYSGPVVSAAVSTGIAAGEHRYTYDANLFVTGWELRTGAESFPKPLAYDADGFLVGDGAFTITRAGPGGRPSARTDGTGTFSFTYDSLGRLTRRTDTVAGKAVFELQLTYDTLDHVVRTTLTAAGVSHAFEYTYDAGGQLLRVTRDGETTEAYSYDANGNRTRSAQTTTYDAQDRLTTRGTVAYTHDSDGFLATRGGDRFVYSVRGELVEARLMDGRIVTYGYDAAGRRVSRTDAAGTTTYLYGHRGQPFRVTASRNQQGVLTQLSYDGLGRVYALDRAGARFYVSSDQVGTPVTVADASGNIVKSVVRDAWGTIVSDSNAAFDTVVGFAGGLPDEATGLVRFGFRDYDPAAGRWTARDPILYAGGQANLYEYAANDPVDRVDRAGLVSELDFKSQDPADPYAQFSPADYLGAAISAIPATGVAAVEAAGAIASAIGAGIRSLLIRVGLLSGPAAPKVAEKVEEKIEYADTLLRNQNLPAVQNVACRSRSYLERLWWHDEYHRIWTELRNQIPGPLEREGILKLDEEMKKRGFDLERWLD
jgi:RHS repeat-associated protein